MLTEDDIAAMKNRATHAEQTLAAAQDDTEAALFYPALYREAMADRLALLEERAHLRHMLAAMYRVAVWAQEFHEYEFFEEFGDMTTLVGEVERTLNDGK